MALTRTIRTLAVVAAFGVALPAAPPTSAVSAGTVEFISGVALACPGFGYPGTPIGSFDVSPNNCPFAFEEFVCADQVSNVAKPGKPPFFIGAACALFGAGTITGYCGYAYGKGAGVLVDSTGNAVLIPSFSFKAVRGTWVIDGIVSKPATGQKGFFSGVADETEPSPILTPAGGSCFTKTATIFTHIGALEYRLL